MDLRQKKENEEIEQRILKAEQALKEAKVKVYLLGKFDPAERKDFAPVPEKYNIGGYKMYLRKETLNAFLKMREAAEADGVELKIASAARNFDYQKDLWNKKWTGYTIVDGEDLSKSISDGRERFKKILEYSAVPSASRHHWGTDIDINNANPKYFEGETGGKVYDWLVKNAKDFGFCQTYNLKGENRPTGHNEEKWHWSYLPLARTFTEEYKNLVKEKDISGFEGGEFVEGEDLIKNYVLSINPDCL
ncbi:MAG: Peptidase M15B and M15C DD-carboxypeptidase VanY/endolysin [Candidatus Nomurabacteria bacterium GW2011_GWF2_40_31]|uniref:Peptidase M15B and M15C DD-carboxypeptidase VanY/endolysin n=2 Tax=Candidatus Nomuraibacteriota TaxID=1752729 RepID=A0A837HWY6_9BACT|nr:MAG: Peptidase M15B and M15C DD-carboxypeptidase VanY/endolysin [Candidatus Nomurabacteria bacterium GW2011_GWD2_39_12]KKR20918.1 MAG: Peptidase M15B and M15C DD-carboxypeptidase VanY/endolysin [Candidatus Nomurabacteria bacterium GW2011_GWC2_39_41]KKR37203.1 MAG: Peptidase M15B and M15C DD-carboxypeptidase VanY/endolysin [Candidatus Nomurabacteria bacterium GW2011_GWE2_40_10]KKR38867.1 MAG: Peptidase M15B and M15C DD-carboxypeptidase VanY/endolysin [Candidatus Nomurabacteria bacterium GW2011